MKGTFVSSLIVDTQGALQDAQLKCMLCVIGFFYSQPVVLLKAHTQLCMRSSERSNREQAY